MLSVPDRASSRSSNNGSASTLDPISKPPTPATSQRSNDDDDSALDPQTTQATVKFNSVFGKEVAPDPRSNGEQELISHDVNFMVQTLRRICRPRLTTLWLAILRHLFAGRYHF